MLKYTLLSHTFRIFIQLLSDVAREFAFLTIFRVTLILIWGQHSGRNVLFRGNSSCKELETPISLVCSRNNDVSLARIDLARGRVIDEVREITGTRSRALEIIIRILAFTLKLKVILFLFLKVSLVAIRRDRRKAP